MSTNHRHKSERSAADLARRPHPTALHQTPPSESTIEAATRSAPRRTAVEQRATNTAIRSESGPLPSAAELGDYEANLEGSGQAIVDEFRSQMQHNREVEQWHLRQEEKMLVASYVFIFSILGAMILAMLKGAMGPAYLLGGVLLIVAVTYFRRSRPPERMKFTRMHAHLSSNEHRSLPPDKTDDDPSSS